MSRFLAGQPLSHSHEAGARTPADIALAVESLRLSIRNSTEKGDYGPMGILVEPTLPEVRQISYQEFLELSEGLTVHDAEYWR